MKIIPFEDSIKTKGNKLMLKLTMFSFYDEDTNCYVAHVPSINISTYGSSISDLGDAIEEAVDLAVNDWIENKSIAEVLNALGWAGIRKGSKKIEAAKEPMFDQSYNNWSQLRSHQMGSLTYSYA